MGKNIGYRSDIECKLFRFGVQINVKLSENKYLSKIQYFYRRFLSFSLVFTFSQEIGLFIFFSQAFEELEDLLTKHDICIAVKEKLVKDSGVAEEIAYDNIVQKLLTKPRARGL